MHDESTREFSRRGFLRHSAFASAAAIGGSALTGSIAAAIEPIERSGPAQFKFSLAAYSYRTLLQGTAKSPPKLTLEDFIKDCAQMGLEGTELTSYYFPQPVTDEYLRKVKGDCFRLGLDVSGTAVRSDFGYPPGDERRRQIDDVNRWVDHAEVLGAPVIRIFAGKVKKGSTPEAAHALIVEGIEECCDYAGRHGVYLALENHGGPTSTIDGILAIVRDVKSPWFGVNLDSGNFRSQDNYADLARLAPYAVNVQVKVVMKGPGGKKKRPTVFSRLAAILRDVGYRGYIVLEYEEDGDPRTECPRYVEKIREAFG